ncbi:MAG: hypothetical protein A2901_00530 [Elusimicrobia bacterium RIFCSPLOWO2_01_FULL_54_10]|nr:MAG: hypothetical protein A2901_00530 [Elusimicrobia bacterium RIFCSPLOWO2_01_FULL_54_10]
MGDIKMKITKNMNVAEIFELYPQTRPVFQKFGFNGLMDAALRNTFGRLTSVEAGCLHHGVDLETFLKALNESVASVSDAA